MEWIWGTHSGKDMGPAEVLWDGDGVPLAGSGQSENITSHRTSYAGGTNTFHKLWSTLEKLFGVIFFESNCPCQLIVKTTMSTLP